MQLQSAQQSAEGWYQQCMETILEEEEMERSRTVIHIFIHRMMIMTRNVRKNQNFYYPCKNQTVKKEI